MYMHMSMDMYAVQNSASTRLSDLAFPSWQLADLWTTSIEAGEYARFLWALLKRVTTYQPGGTKTWRELHEVIATDCH